MSPPSKFRGPRSFLPRDSASLLTVATLLGPTVLGLAPPLLLLPTVLILPVPTLEGDREVAPVTLGRVASLCSFVVAEKVMEREPGTVVEEGFIIDEDVVTRESEVTAPSIACCSCFFFSLTIAFWEQKEVC